MAYSFGIDCVTMSISCVGSRLTLRMLIGLSHFVVVVVAAGIVGGDGGAL